MTGARGRPTVRIGRPRRFTLYILGIGVWLSGVLWLLSHYLLQKRGEFGPQSQPLEPWSLKVHGAFAFGSIWLFGLLWDARIKTAWPLCRRRLSGGALAGVFIWLILSGYLLYYVGEDTPRAVVSALHWSLGVACPVFYAAHRVSFRRRN